MSDWWSDFYDDTIADLFLVRGPEEEAATTRFLEERLALRPGSAVFDQCCGIGTVSLPLARRGHRVVGIDLCGPYIERAKRAGLGDYRAADAFEFVAPGPCDGAFNWYSSFGYAPDDGRNLLMLRRAFESLRPGGRFALDYLNVPGVFRDFKERMERRRDGVSVLRECRLDLRKGTLEQVWTTTAPDGARRSRPSSVRLYLPRQLAELLEKAGFEGVEMFGGVDGSPLTPASPRCILTAVRP